MISARLLGKLFHTIRSNISLINVMWVGVVFPCLAISSYFRKLRRIQGPFLSSSVCSNLVPLGIFVAYTLQLNSGSLNKYSKSSSLTFTPVSSSVSLTAAFIGFSFPSTFPPGDCHIPYMTSPFLIERNTPSLSYKILSTYLGWLTSSSYASTSSAQD